MEIWGQLFSTTQLTHSKVFLDFGKLMIFVCQYLCWHLAGFEPATPKLAGPSLNQYTMETFWNSTSGALVCKCTEGQIGI